MLVVDGRRDVRAEIAAAHSEFRNADIELTKARSGHKDMTVFIPALILVNYQPDFSGSLGNVEAINYKDSQAKNIIQTIWEHIPKIRVYTKTGGKVARKPVVMKKNSTVVELAEHVHKDFVSNFKYARIWGSGSFPGQQVGTDYVLKDKDVVEIYTS